VKLEQTAPSSRFLRNYAKKSGGLPLRPNTKDGAVDQEEFLKLLVTKFGKASEGGAKIYSLVNEPAHSLTTHPKLHPAPASDEEVIQRSEAFANAILSVDPSAFIVGGVMFGWGEYLNLTSSGNFEKYNQVYDRYVDYYLAMMQKVEKRNGKRLIHAL